MKKIKVREVFLNNSDNSFSHFSYWGLINHKYEFDDGCFMGQSQSNMAHRVDNQMFTGLLDKSGKEIFDGDIVQIEGGGAITVAEVCYITPCYQLRIKNHGLHNFDAFDLIKVIGSIYENPELLK